ncbi:S1 family peptidase [Lysobacter enzymogenes]|uniref:S1 family peptidase n=1 Tax=Lysobacter enzymogenes TaxID=69 RepID=UPI003749FAE6
MGDRASSLHRPALTRSQHPIARLCHIASRPWSKTTRSAAMKAKCFVMAGALAGAGIAAMPASAASAALARDVVSEAVSGASMRRELALSAPQLSSAWQAQRLHASQGAALRARMGRDYAGSWIEADAAGRYRWVVASSGAGRVSLPAGAELRYVRHRLATLQAAKARLDAAVAGKRFAGVSRDLSGLQSWYVDPRSNAVVVGIARGGEREAADLIAASGADASVLRLEVSSQRPQPNVSIFGGMVYFRHPSWCSGAFAVTQGAVPGFLTAGHCGQPGKEVWEKDGESVLVGVFMASQFPGKDQAWVRTSIFWTLYALVADYQGGFLPVHGSVEAPVGSPVCRSGGGSGYQCGWVTATQVTVNYPEGAIYGLSQSNACSAGGDSGGAWIDGLGQAQGVHSGNASSRADRSNCDIPQDQRQSWFQPINPILLEYQLGLVTQ